MVQKNDYISLEDDNIKQVSDNGINSGFLLVFTVLISIVLWGSYLGFKRADNEFENSYNSLLSNVDMAFGIKKDNLESWYKKHINKLISVTKEESLQLYIMEVLGSFKKQPTSGFFGQNTSNEPNNVQIASRKFLQDKVMSISRLLEVDYENNKKSGIAIFSKDGDILASTPKFDFDFTQKRKNNLLQNKNIVKNFGNNVNFIIPVYSIQSDGEEDGIIAYLIASKKVTELEQILKSPKTDKNIYTSQIFANNNLVAEHISEGFTDKVAKEKIISFANNNLVSGAKRFSQKYDLLLSTYKIPNSDWIIAYYIGYKDAIKPLSERRKSFKIAIISAVAVLILIFLALWRHGSSLKYKRLAYKFHNQEQLLRLVSENQPDSMMIIDKDNHIRYANRKTAKLSNYDNGDVMLGHNITNIFGEEKSDKYSGIIKDVLTDFKYFQNIRDEKIFKKGIGEVRKIVQANYIPLKQIPTVDFEKKKSGVLVVEQDITEAITQKENNEKILSDMIEMIVGLMDMRDTYTAEHSAKVANLSKEIAKQMNLSEDEIYAAETAGRLMNIGKVLLPKDLLTKKGKLTAKDKKQISDAIASGCKFLEKIKFNGPVAKTLSQSQEYLDGSGPLKLKDKKIITPARVVNLANAYIALISPRAYRDKLDKQKALEILMSDSGVKYDKKAISALMHYVNNLEEN